MDTGAWKAETEKAGERAVAAAQDVAARGATYAKDQVSDFAKQGQQLAREANEQLEKYSGRSGGAWLSEASRLIKHHPWKAVALTAVAVYVLGKLRA